MYCVVIVLMPQVDLHKVANCQDKVMKVHFLENVATCKVRSSQENIPIAE